MTDSLRELMGIETEPAEVAWRLREYVQELNPPIVGAYQITCSDEAEWACARAFQQGFVEPLLPGLKPTCRAPLRSVNLGARFEPGALRIVEEHFATPETQRGGKLLVVKINSHVGACLTAGGVEYGWSDRYRHRVTCCGTLTGLLAGKGPPVIAELRELFCSGGKDRWATLRDEEHIPASHRALCAAVVNARLQADRAISEAERHRPQSPTVYLIVACATINQTGPDSEIVVGQCRIDWTGDSPITDYEGLGDDPSTYRVRFHQNRVRLTDDRRPARRAESVVV